MAVHRSIISLITDGNGLAKKEFLHKTPAEWADEQMALRYSQSKMADDKPQDFPFMCWQHLCDEHIAMLSWFDKAGNLNPLVSSASMTNRLQGPLGSGISWDWKSNGDPDVRMFLFKGPLIAAWRAAQLIPYADRNSGNMQMGGIATVVRGAYTERAKIHRWIGYDREGNKISGDNMSRRWVAHMTNNFLISLGADRKWAWDVSKSKTIFGPIEEDAAV